MQLILLGIDNTDIATSRGTGCLARQLSKEIEKCSLGKVSEVSRHQLFLDRRIPYTSRNSSACLTIRTNHSMDIVSLPRKFLRLNSAEGSDAGFAVASSTAIGGKIINFGQSAKKSLLSMERALMLADHYDVYLEGVTGTKEGIIGALAGVGLRASGNDGRCIWLAGTELRDLQGTYSIEEICRLTGIHAVIDLNGGVVPSCEKIAAGDWVRPIIRNNRIILIAQKKQNTKNYEWKVATADIIKRISD